jgi:TolA-binding protein
MDDQKIKSKDETREANITLENIKDSVNVAISQMESNIAFMRGKIEAFREIVQLLDKLEG